MNIKIETILHENHRYTTVGDWYFEGEDIVIKVSKLSDWRREALIAVHELVEVLLCKHEGVTQAQVDKFDNDYEANRSRGDESEPGDASDAPYRKQHCIATGIERMLAAELGVDWKPYEDELGELPDAKPKA